MKNKILILIIHVLILSIGKTSFANTSTCTQIYSDPSVEDNSGASVESEIFVTPLVLKLLTTSNGLVSGLYKNEDLPPFYLEWVHKNFPHKNPRDMEWDLVNPEIQLQLLKELYGTKLMTPFYVNRTVPNMSLKRVVHLKFKKQTSFLGIDYHPGEYDIDISKVFSDRIEYLNDETQKNFAGLELHLTSSEIPAEELLEFAYVFNDAIGSEPFLHEHLVAKIPESSFKENLESLKIALNITEYYRRANLLSEFITILEHKSISKKNTALYNYFNTMSPNYLEDIFSYFFKRKNPQEIENHKLGTRLKIAWVGFRGADFYKPIKKNLTQNTENIQYTDDNQITEDSGAYGFEWRAFSLNPTLRNLYKKIISLIHLGMKNENYGFSVNSMLDWLSLNEGVIFKKDDSVNNERFLKNELYKITTRLEAGWYVKYYDKIPPYIRHYFSTAQSAREEMRRLVDFSNGNYAVYLLIHDWKSDFLFYNDKKAQNTLIKEQLRALSRVYETTDDLKIILSDFITNSGLLSKVLQTYNLNETEFIDTINKARSADKGKGLIQSIKNFFQLNHQ